MNIKEITAEQLRAENPELFQSIRNQGVTEERERMTQIDELTDEGYEELAQSAKANGTSAADFLKQVVAERNKKKKGFVSARQTETAPAASVAGGQPADNDGKKTEDEEIAAAAKEAADMAKEFCGAGSSMY